MTAGTRRRAPGFFGDEARSDSSDTRESLLKFLGPRYWRVWMLAGWLRLAAQLPWRWSLALHMRAGRWLGSKSGKSARIVSSNLAQCFPELDDSERAELAADYFANMGAMVAELALAWYGSIPRIRSMYTIEGREHLEAALAGGRGVLLCAGHFTTIELCVVAVSGCAPRYAMLYNKRRNRLLSELQRRGMERCADDTIQKRDIRRLLRNLRQNAATWYLSDEAHTGKSSTLLPFFGEPALTNTALPRLARISGAAVVPVFFCRSDDNARYLVRFDPPLEGFPGKDDIADTQRLVALLETQIRECPAQYFWKQKRFRQRRADG